MRPQVFVSRNIPHEGIDLLRKDCDVTVSPFDRVLTKKELIEGLYGKDALLCLLTDKIDSEVLDSNPKLRMVSNYAVGFDNVDVKACTDRQIPVTNTPEVSTDAVADHALALMLSISKRIAEADKYSKAGKYTGWSPMTLMGNDVHAKTLGVIGLGRIGKAVALRAHHGFRMKIFYYDIVRDTSFEKQFGATFCTVEELLQKSDFVSLHVPLLPQTHHLLNDAHFKMMKPTAYLINTARGPVIDEEALVRALQNKTIAGAAIDVLEHEPKLTAGMETLENLIVTPHIASTTYSARSAMSILAAQNILDVIIHGKPAKHQLNKHVQVGDGFKFPFFTHSKKALKNLADLHNYLETTSDAEYFEFANAHKNDFATWVHDVLKNSRLATKLKHAKNRLDAAKIVKEE